MSPNTIHLTCQRYKNAPQVDGLKKQFGLSLFIADKSDPLADGTVKDLEIDYESAKGSPRGNTISNDGRLVQVGRLCLFVAVFRDKCLFKRCLVQMTCRLRPALPGAICM